MLAALAAASGLWAAAALAQPEVAGEPGAAMLAIRMLPASSATTLTVSSPAFANGGDIPFENTSYRGNVFPGLSWTPGPAGTKSYAIVMQDDDGIVRGAPVLHWTMYDIPPDVTSLPPGMTAPPTGAAYGPNIVGPNHAYIGPHTPPGPRHHYHLQVFALDATVPADPTLSYAALTGAMNGHVLASGELVGLGRADPDAPPRPPPPPPPTN